MKNMYGWVMLAMEKPLDYWSLRLEVSVSHECRLLVRVDLRSRHTITNIYREAWLVRSIVQERRNAKYL